MNYANVNLAKTEIIKQIGYFPAFLLPAIKSSLIYQSLVQQTLFAYINNPLPARFKEKLFVLLSRYYGVEYFTICHSCTLRSLGLSALEVLALGELEYPQSEADVVEDLTLLRDRWDRSLGWQDTPELETSLLRCACLLFLYPKQTANLSASLKECLGTVYYHYLIVLLGYIKLCHQWSQSNGGIQHQQDRRSQLHLGSLLLEEAKLAEFLRSTPPLVSSDSRPASNSQGDLNSSVRVAAPQLQQIKQKTLATCLSNAPFPVMIHNRQGKIMHLNRNWLEASGYDLEEISTLDDWKQKAQVRQREIVRLATKNTSQLYQKYVASAHNTAIEASETLQQIIDSLIEIAPESTRAKLRLDRKRTEAVRSEVTGITKNGDRLYWELYSTTLSLESEADELIISIAKDITEVVDYEAKLAEAEAKLKLVLSTTKTATWSWNLHTHRVDVCHRGRAILGLEDFDGSYESFLQSIRSDERESIDLEIAKAIQAHQDLDITYSVVKADGQVGLVRAKGRLKYNSLQQPLSLEGILIELNDLSSSRTESVDKSALEFSVDCIPLVESAIAQSNNNCARRELKTVLDLIPNCLFVVNLESQAISLINAQLSNSLGLGQDEAMGQTIAECFPAPYADQIAWQHQQAIDSGRALHVQEKVALADGTHYFDTLVTPLVNDTGHIYALLHTCCDIPDLAATQEALSQRTIQLEAAN
ncbi:MAG: PAS domain S-box protein, partial [Cyanobacteria bacterium J06623_1]